MIKLVVIDHSFFEPTYRKRWKLLAKRHPVEVTLLVPKVWKFDWFGETAIYEPDPVADGNYRVVPLPTTTKQNWSKYFFLSPDAKFREIDPDVIHIQHSEMALIHHQIIPYKKLWASDATITFFTMNALGVRQEKWHQRFRWRHLKNNVQAALCHYPGCRESLRDAAFEKPIYQQTSYGVDEDLFAADSTEREEVREELGVSDSFVIGYAGRLTADKGVDDLLATLPLDGVDWSLLLLGDGEMWDDIGELVRNEGWEDRVILPGFVEKDVVARYMKAMDVYVLGSKTRENWIDTFPRSIVEAMATEIPVIGSDSGAIPYQVGDAGIIYPEGDVSALKAHLTELASDPARRERLGEQGRKASVSRFGQRTLADNFYKILQQLHTDDIRYNEGGESCQYKAYSSDR